MCIALCEKEHKDRLRGDMPPQHLRVQHIVHRVHAGMDVHRSV
jgi:hypothetical protein